MNILQIVILVTLVASISFLFFGVLHAIKQTPTKEINKKLSPYLRFKAFLGL